MRIGSVLRRNGIGWKLAAVGFGVQALASLLLGLSLLLGQSEANAAAVSAGVLTFFGFIMATVGVFVMYYDRRKKHHLVIGFLLLVYFLVNFMMYDSSLVQFLLVLAYTVVMMWSSARDKDIAMTLLTGSALALYVAVPLTLGSWGISELAMGLVSSAVSAYRFAVSAVYMYKG